MGLGATLVLRKPSNSVHLGRWPGIGSDENIAIYEAIINEGSPRGISVNDAVG